MNLFENPFYVLGASLSDNRQRLRALYDEKLLLCPPKEVDAALQELTHPLKRLERESQEKQKLIREKGNLQAKRKRLGLFSKKEKRRIDEEIAGIERKLKLL